MLQLIDIIDDNFTLYDRETKQIKIVNYDELVNMYKTNVDYKAKNISYFTDFSYIYGCGFRKIENEVFCVFAEAHDKNTNAPLFKTTITPKFIKNSYEYQRFSIHTLYRYKAAYNSSSPKLFVLDKYDYTDTYSLFKQKKDNVYFIGSLHLLGNYNIQKRKSETINISAFPYIIKSIDKNNICTVITSNLNLKQIPLQNLIIEYNEWYSTNIPALYQYFVNFGDKKYENYDFPQVSGNFWRVGNSHYFLYLINKQAGGTILHFSADAQYTNQFKTYALRTKLCKNGIPAKSMGIENDTLISLDMSLSAIGLNYDTIKTYKEKQQDFVILPPQVTKITKHALNFPTSNTKVDLKIPKTVIYVDDECISTVYSRVTSEYSKYTIDLAEANINVAAKITANVYKKNYGYALNVLLYNNNLTDLVTILLQMHNTFISTFTNCAYNPFSFKNYHRSTYINDMDMITTEEPVDGFSKFMAKSTPFLVITGSDEFWSKVGISIGIKPLGTQKTINSIIDICKNLTEQDLVFLDMFFNELLPKDNTKKRTHKPKYKALETNSDIQICYKNKYYLNDDYLYPFTMVAIRESWGKELEKMNFLLCVNDSYRHYRNDEHTAFVDIVSNFVFFFNPSWIFINNKNLASKWETVVNNQLSFMVKICTLPEILEAGKILKGK